jgi:hypothetical protein
MATPTLKDVLPVALTNVATGLVLAYAFATAEVTRWSQERPTLLLVFIVIGVVFPLLAIRYLVSVPSVAKS